MAQTSIINTTINMGHREKSLKVMRAIAEAIHVNAEAALALSKAMQGAEQQTGIHVAGDSTSNYHRDPWRGQGFYSYPTAEPEAEGDVA